ncbi:hypothetical protein D1BOALGB6SA_10413 [Olavius sp. associated proteobacterium Delta 1]|nr:hypothetical protein D1BOALGB6SA_10413 [Olavius sp. associated proteobacterium Delta 1]
MTQKVTVYIPCYNYASFVDRAIRSVIAQTMSDWELIIINDGSTDNTSEIVSKYRDQPKIRIVEQENKGLTISNNIALRLANGKYIIRLDADDYFDENILSILSNILDTKPEVGLVFPDYYHIDENGEIIEIVRRKKIREEVELLDLPAHGACTMIRKRCLIELKGYEEEFSCQDGYELWIKFINKFKPYNVNLPLFYYRQHPKSLTNNQEKILQNRREIKKSFVNKYHNGQRPKVLAVIPVTGKSIYSQSNPFTKLAGEPLIWYTLSEVIKAEMLDKIVLSSEDDQVINYAKQFPDIITHKRSEKLTTSTTKVENIVLEVLSNLKKTINYEIEAICILYITTPMRRSYIIDKAIDTMTIFNVDSVISIQEELSFCYFHRKFGLSPIKNNRREIRVERDAIFRENGALFLSKVDVINEGKLLGKKIGHITMLPEESIKINSDYDLWLCEKIIQDWWQRDKNQNLV